MTKELLSEFYSNDFISSLPQDSRLHKILTTDLPQTENLRIEIDKCLELAHRYKLIDADLESRLRSSDGQIWQSAMNELRVALQFEIIFGKDCLTWRPIGDKQKVGEFELNAKGNRPIFIEIKSVFPRELDQMGRRLITKLHKYVEKSPYPYILDITVIELGDSDNFSSRRFLTFLKQNLSALNEQETIKQPIELPIYFDEITNTKLSITVLPIQPEPNSTASHLGVSSLGVRLVNNADYIKHSLSKAYSQIPKNETNCLVILCSETEFPIDERAMLNALLGTLAYRIYREKGRQNMPFRKPDGYFQPDRNTYISAVGLFDSKIIESEIISSFEVYHNPHARNPLQSSAFLGKGIRQLVRKNDKEMEWID